MRKGGSVIAALAITAGTAASAEARSGVGDCKVPDPPYHDYGCLDAFLGDGFFERLVNYYRLEWGHGVAPTDPKAPPQRRDQWPPTPVSSPPFPFTEWPYGGATALGVTRPSSIDSPLMAALANTELGRAMNESHIQVYGWVDFGGNISSTFPSFDSFQKPLGRSKLYLPTDFGA
jgi:hypothetical protein